MTPEERQLIDDLYLRMREASTDDRDREAEAHINQQVRQFPLAPYLLTQTVLVLEQNAEEQANYIQDLEARIQELEQAQRGGPGTSSGGGGGFLGRGRSVGTPPASGRRDDQGYDARYEEPQGRPQSGSGIPQIGSRAGEYGAPYGQGGGRPPMGSPIPPQAPPGAGIPPQQPPAQAASGGGGFLKTALATAAAVAGGVLVMDALKGMMGGSGANAKQGELNDSNNDPADYQSSSSSSPVFNDDNNDPGGDL